MNVGRQLFAGRVHYDYGTISVHDESELRRSVEAEEGPAWTDAHCRQGFIRQSPGQASFGLLTRFDDLGGWGEARLSIDRGAYRADGPHERAIQVPFVVSSGRIVVSCDVNYEDDIKLEMPPGPYRLTVAQWLDAAAGPTIALLSEELGAPIAVSRIVVTDAELAPLDPLLELGDPRVQS